MTMNKTDALQICNTLIINKYPFTVIRLVKDGKLHAK